jgi:predicted DNA-binding transcriptional regulator YafY
MRADRLISIMLLLHSKGRMTAQDLARQVEVSERTVYRDLDALSSAGIPIYTQSGPNGGVYLDEHYRLSLTGLSREEVQALFVSNDAGPLKDLGLAKRDTLLKLFAALPSMHRTEVERLHQRFHIDSANWFQIVEQQPFLPLLQRAVWEDRRVEVTYQPVEGEPGVRILDAYALVAKANIWYLVGKKPDAPCTAMRNYRLSRFQTVVVTETHFDRNHDFDLARYWRETCEQFERLSRETFPPYVAILRVHQDVFWYFPAYMEGYYQKIDEPDQEGWMRLCVTFQSLGEARMRVLGLGAKASVVEPDELRRGVLDVAQAIIEHYQV